MTTLPPTRKTAAELLGVRAQPRNARDRLVDKAIDLFYTYGFNAVGIDRILTEAGVTKTTFYKYFESKDDLLVAAVKRRDRWELKAWRRAVRRMAGPDPRAQLLGFFDVLDEWFNAPDFQGCMFLNAAAEFPNPHDPVHQAAAEHKLQFRRVIRDLAKKAGVTDPDTFADLYNVIFEGTLVVRQVQGNHAAARQARPMIEQLLERFQPADAR